MTDPLGEGRTWAGGALPELPDVTLSEVIGTGGMGAVFRGRQSYLERDVAVKLLLPGRHGEEFEGRFRREAKLLAGLQHPNVVTCHQAGVAADGTCYMVMELVPGPDLRRYLDEHGPLPAETALLVTADLAAALGHARAAGVLHRDVKCANVLLAPSPERSALAPGFPFVPKLADLGLARALVPETSTDLTAAGQVLGTPTNMAPELFSDPEGADHRVDVYALGCVLFRMLTGQAAFPQRTVAALYAAKVRGEVPDPRTHVAGVPAAAARVVAECLARDPAARPREYGSIEASCRSLAASLREARARRRRRRRRLGLAALGAGVSVALLVALVPGLRHSATPRVQAGPDRSVQAGELVSLRAIASDPECQVQWEVVEPTGLDAAALGLAPVEGPEIAFTAPDGFRSATDLRLRCWANDGEARGSDDVVVRVAPPPRPAGLVPGERRELFRPEFTDALADWRYEPGAPRVGWSAGQDGGAEAVPRADGSAEIHRGLPAGPWILEGRVRLFGDEARGTFARAGVRIEFEEGPAAMLVVSEGPRVDVVLLEREPAAGAWRELDRAGPSIPGEGADRTPLDFRIAWDGEGVAFACTCGKEHEGWPLRVPVRERLDAPADPAVIALRADDVAAAFTGFVLAPGER